MLGITVLAILGCTVAAFVVALILAIFLAADPPTFVTEAIMLVLLTLAGGSLLIIVDNIRHRIAVRKVRRFLKTLPSLSFEDFCEVYTGYKKDFLQDFREVTAGYLAIEEDKVGPALHFGPGSPLEPVTPLLYCVLFERFCPNALQRQKMEYPMGSVETLEDLIRETEQLIRREI